MLVWAEGFHTLSLQFLRQICDLTFVEDSAIKTSMFPYFGEIQLEIKKDDY